MVFLISYTHFSVEWTYVVIIVVTSCYILIFLLLYMVNAWFQSTFISPA